MKVTRQSWSIPVSQGWMLSSAWAEQWPRRVAERIEHPVTPEQQAAYDAYKARFVAAVREYEAVIAEGEGKGWAYGGYVEEGPSLHPLEPRTEYIYAETIDEHRDRVLAVVKHHRETGEWLEEPQPTLMERVMNQAMSGWMSVVPSDAGGDS